MSVDDRDRKIALSIALGTLAIVFNILGGPVGHALFIASGAVAVACLALYWPWYRRPLAWLRSQALRWRGHLRLPTLRRRPELPAPVITDRWRYTLNGFEVPPLAHLGEQIFDHRAYSRSAEKTPPFVHIRAIVACSSLGDTPGWQDLRGRFLGLISQAAILNLISQLTVIPDGTIWRERATSRRSWLEADMTGDDEAEVPAR